MRARFRRSPDTGDSDRPGAAELVRRIEALDESLFEGIPSQTTANDRQSLLALHAAARNAYASFSYLEIGSHLGGSLQVLIADPACTSISSIDSRPAVQPDERGFDFPYPSNSTEAMVALLERVPGADLSKLRTFDADASEVALEQLAERPRICLVDGEHTDEAVQRDAEYCLRVLDPRGGVIAFHDLAVVYRGLKTWLDRSLGAGEHWLTPFPLPDSMFALEVGELRVRDSPHVQARIQRQWEGTLWMLESNDRYREFFRSQPIQAMRRLGLTPPIDES